MFQKNINGYTFKPLRYSESVVGTDGEIKSKPLIRSCADLSSFRPDSEQIRAFKFNPEASGQTPAYDYPDGKVPKDNPITDEIVLLRSGKLDKADADALKAKIIADAKRSNDDAYAERVKKAMEDILGFNDKKDDSDTQNA